MEATLDYSAKPRAAKPLSERINFRIVIFLSVLALVFGWVLWQILDTRIAVKDGDYLFVDLKGMGNFPFDAQRDGPEVIPKEVRELDGKKVKFNGEMFAPDSSSAKVQQFQLVYSIVQCCMGGPPKVQERVFAFAPPKSAGVPNYGGQQVTVTGTLHIKVVRQPGEEATSVFTMDVDDVQDRS
jgi:hypothetical protein